MTSANKLTLSLVTLGAFTLGWFAHRTNVVHAAESGPFLFQVQGTGGEMSLSIYDTSDRTIYVYLGATGGSSNVNCSYKFHLSARHGGPLTRTNCPIGSPLPETE